MYRQYVHNLKITEWTHPPLGKLIQAIPIKITNKMTPFHYRLMSNISGILLIIVMYQFGKFIFQKRRYAIISALLMIFDIFGEPSEDKPIKVKVSKKATANGHSTLTLVRVK